MRLYYPLISLCLTLVFLTISALNAQAYNNEQGGVSIPSAAALSYGKYADIPVNQYTGTGNVAVPLFSVSDGPLSLAVGLQYHTGGIPVGTPAGAVGLGWNLNYGGMISRVIRGTADDRFAVGYYNAGTIINTSIAQDVADGTKDSEPDIYTYTAGGYSGKFTFAADRSVKMIPQSDVKVIVDEHLNGFNKFTIITPDGTKYHYGKSSDGTREAFDYATSDGGAVGLNDRVGWHLLEIETHDSKHQIDIFYENIGYKYTSLGSCLGVVKYRKSSGNIDTEDNCTTLTQENKIKTVLPSRIETPLQTITFSSSSRNDLDDFDSSYQAKKISRVEMIDGPNCVSFDFFQSYFESDETPTPAKRLRLNSVQKISCVTGSTLDEPEWSFDYYGTVLSTGKQFFPAYDDLNVDHWGYYNYDESLGSNTGDLTPPSQYFLGNGYIYYGDANRESNEAAMLNGALARVTYPTGGYLDIDYEANEYFKAGTNQLYTDLMSCQTTNCGGYETETSAPISFTQDMIDNGSWELCLIAFDDSGAGNGYDPNNNLARVEVFNSGDTLIQTREFNSTTDFCQTGSFPFISIGPAIEAGQSYTFKVTSLNANATFRITAPGDGANEIA